MNRKKLKTLLILLIAASAITGILVGLKKKLSSSSYKNETYTVKEESYENVIQVSGVVSAAQEQTLKALSSGTVVRVNVKQGDYVHKGDLIMQLDDTTEKYNLAKHDYDMETTRISGSRKELALKETQRLSLVRKVEERKVTATFDGIIADIDVKVGDYIEAKDSVGTLVDVSYLIADVEIAETDVSKLKKNQEVEFNFSANYGQPVKGYVVSWPAIGEITSRGATVVQARLRIDEFPDTILPKFSFSGKIQIAPKETFLIVEKYAVKTEDEQAYVELKNGGKEEVVVMPYGPTYVKIISGNVKDGDVLKAQSEVPASGYGMGMPGGRMPPKI